VRKAQNEAAEQLKSLSAREQAAEQARQQYESALRQLLQTLQSAQASEFADIRTIADVEKLAREDWPRYLQWDLAQKKIAAAAQELQAAQQRQGEERRQQFAEFARREDDLFVEKVPEMADTKRAEALQRSAMGSRRACARACRTTGLSPDVNPDGGGAAASRARPLPRGTFCPTVALPLPHPQGEAEITAGRPGQRGRPFMRPGKLPPHAAGAPTDFPHG
jgi:hypothetical protein